MLSEAQKEEVVAQADSHLKTAKGRGYRRQVTRGEVVQLLSGLPRDKGSGLISFHDAQALITRYRDKQIARFKVIFPDLTSGGGGGGGDDECGCECEALAKIQREGSARSPEMPGLVSKKTEQQQACPANKAGALKGGSGGGGGRRRGERRRAKFSPDVAPAEMFVKDAGLTPAGVAKYVSPAKGSWTFVIIGNRIQAKMHLMGSRAVYRLYSPETPKFECTKMGKKRSLGWAFEREAREGRESLPYVTSKRYLIMHTKPAGLLF